MPDGEVVTVATDAGMLALWHGSAFAEIDRLEAWEERVEDRLTEAIQSAELVPVGIQSDGGFGVRVAVARIKRRNARLSTRLSPASLTFSLLMADLRS